MNTKDKQHFTELLRSRSLKATVHRVDLLVNMNAHKSAIPFSGIQKIMPNMDRVTLYRTMDALVKKGIIHQAYREESERYYALCGAGCDTEHHNHEHLHFKCNICEEVTCQQLSQKINIELADYDIHQISMNASGVCPNCR